MTYKAMVRWGDTNIEYLEARRRTDEAKKLCVGLSLVSTERRSGYDGDYTVSVPDYYGIAQLIERVQKEPRTEQLHGVTDVLPGACPLCGGMVIIDGDDSGPEDRYWAMCDGCLICTHHSQTPDGVYDQWITQKEPRTERGNRESRPGGETTAIKDQSII